ncbi:hypothetical protein ACN27F_15845 [Solwaraspora sp. WMMB335]|uniref:hypothetical protein n=1 Tax=Solwaraspora sp. WMMB335 TaxID=3404118 RepID=UPI003B943020
MVHVRAGLDHGETLLGADGDHRGEVGAGRHAGHLPVTPRPPMPPTQPGETCRDGRQRVDDTAQRSLVQDIVPGPGGVMTDEVGVVTGPLTLRTELTAGEVTLRVQYQEADEWYVVTGGRARLADPADLDAVHAVAVGLLHRPDG